MNVTYSLDLEIPSHVLAEEIRAVCVTSKDIKLYIYQSSESLSIYVQLPQVVWQLKGRVWLRAEGHMFTRLLESCR